MTEPSSAHPLNRREFLARAVVVVGLPGIANAAAVPVVAPPNAAGPARLQMLTEGYPRSFFWWTTCRQLH
ncbi:MAG: hypothetical protein KJ579_09565, partial [Verrucomicrobia bacterium]|nr:hypothetical protein [Verrucomicrobiota bacterium]